MCGPISLKGALALVTNQSAETSKRTRVVRPYPMDSLEEALVIARAIKSEYAGHAVGLLDLAQAVGRKPNSSAFRSLITSSNKYGLTDGSYNSPQMSLTPRGLAAVAPRDESETPKALVVSPTGFD